MLGNPPLLAAATPRVLGVDDFALFAEGAAPKVGQRTRRLLMRWISLCPPEKLKPEEKTLLERLLNQDAGLALGHKLLHKFRRAVADRDVAGLERWLVQAKSSNPPSFAGLANGIETDRAAAAALKLLWSNGPTEGHINRLKLTKRQDYGRAKFDLIRARVLAALSLPAD